MLSVIKLVETNNLVSLLCKKRKLTPKVKIETLSRRNIRNHGRNKEAVNKVEAQRERERESAEVKSKSVSLPFSCINRKKVIIPKGGREGPDLYTELLVLPWLKLFAFAC